MTGKSCLGLLLSLYFEIIWLQVILELITASQNKGENFQLAASWNFGKRKIRMQTFSVSNSYCKEFILWRKAFMTCLLLIFWSDIQAGLCYWALWNNLFLHLPLLQVPSFHFPNPLIHLIYEILFFTSQMHELDKNCTAFTSPSPNIL